MSRDPAADQKGRHDWLNAIKNGSLKIDDVEGSFYASNEWFAKSGGTNSAWVSSLYTRIIMRVPADSEVSFWAKLADQNGRDWVVRQFWRAYETAKSRVAPMYLTYLGRAADAGGLAGWTTYEIEFGDSATRAALSASAEYFGRTQVLYP